MPLVSLPVAIAALVVASVAVLLAGPRMVRVAEEIASRTKLGQALMGAVFVGAATSLPDTVATITPAVGGLADLAVANALGGVLGQTAFLAIADIAFRTRSLVRATTSLATVVQAAVLVLQLSLVVALFQGPQGAVFGIHPATPALFVVYAIGIRIVARASDEPMWRAVRTGDEVFEPGEDGHEEHDTDPRRSVGSLWRSFALLTLVLGVAGWTLIPSAESIVAATGLTRTAAGTFLTGVASSLAELVVSVSAVRAGALALALGNVFGGNMFDAMLVGAADIAYREGSIYASVTPEHSLIAAVSIVATAVLLVALLRRGRAPVGNVAPASLVVLALYLATIFVVAR